MPNAPDATLIDAQGRPTLHFERVLPHPVDRVWRALSETDELRTWHPTPYALSGRRLQFMGDGPPMPDVEVVELDPPAAARPRLGRRPGALGAKRARAGLPAGADAHL